MFIFSIHKVTHSTSLILDLFLKKIGGAKWEGNPYNFKKIRI